MIPIKTANQSKRSFSCTKHGKIKLVLKGKQTVKSIDFM